MIGNESTVAADVGGNRLGNGGNFDASHTGVLVYGPAVPRPLASLRWFDRAGRETGVLADADQYNQFRIAPDGRRVAVSIPSEETATRSIWVLEPGETAARLTQPRTNDWFPVWSRDGTRIAFASYRDGPLNIYVGSTAQAGKESPVVISPNQKEPVDWSLGDTHLLFREARRNLVGDLSLVDMATGGKALEMANTDSEERTGRFSPDGRWIAYTSDETGRPEIWVQPFPPTGVKWQISVTGGDEATWGPGELFYLRPDGKLIARSIRSGTTFVSSPERELFTAGRAIALGGSQRYDVSSDGARFLVSVPVPTGPPPRAIAIVNWPATIAR